MKKKSFLAILTLLIAACALLITACPDDPGKTPQHTDPAFLEGRWSNQEGDRSFTINNDLSFLCQLTVPGLNQLGQVSGKLDATNANLGPNDYLMKSLVASGETSEFPGNSVLAPMMLSPYQNKPVKIEPNAGKTEFTFSGLGDTGGAVTQFFGGTYTKQH